MTVTTTHEPRPPMCDGCDLPLRLCNWIWLTTKVLSCVLDGDFEWAARWQRQVDIELDG